MQPWTEATDREASALVGALLGAEGKARDAAWHRLLALLGPYVEVWAASSWMLRRMRLDSEDDTRAVLVKVIARLRKDDHANLRAFVERRTLPAPPTEGLEVVAKLGPVVVDAPEAIDAGPEDDASTPFRGWLLRLLRFTSLDHARERYGQGQTSRRAAGTDAAPLSEAPPLAHRPPITDAMTAKRVLEDVLAYLATFPEPMRRALELWMTDVPYAEISEQLALGPPEASRKLVRAAHARLRERFREPWQKVL